MALRCLLFTTDEGTTQSVRQALTDLGVNTEHCTVAVEAVQKVTNTPINLLIVDWDNHTEAAFLLKTARERKASERPLTLAIVSRDLNVSQALQAGANSILRKPIVAAQVRDSLTSACDLLRSRQDASANSQAASAAAAAATGAAVQLDPDASKKILRAGEFLQSTTAPGPQFVTEGDVQKKIEKTIEEAAVKELDPLKDLEPVAAAVEAKVEAKSVDPQPPSSPGEPRGLAWYLKARAATLSPPSPAPASPAAPELIRYDQGPPDPAPTVAATDTLSEIAPANGDAKDQIAGPYSDSNKKTDALFAHMAKGSPSQPEHAVARSGPWPRRMIFAGALMAVCAVAYVTVPPNRWHENLKIVTSNAVHFAQSWLNPQAATPVQVPTTHENFGLAGDEYKLPIAQNIPDATTDPTQIRVVPVVDPTAKQPNGAAANADPTTEDPAHVENSTQNPSDQPQTTVQVQETAQPGPASPVAGDPAASSVPPALPKLKVEPAPTTVPAQAPTPARRDPMQAVTNSRPPDVRVTTSLKPTAGIPSSLRSQMASPTPEASGNKPVESALPSIEPVTLPEASARSLLLQKAEPEYPATAKSQQGNVVLQVLIGRDGSVQDTKFLQGSLAFARAATDAVRQWRFKPYTMNGRPVSVQTILTLSFKPAS